MRITQKAWNKYITKMSAISGTAAEKMQEYVSAHGFDDMKAVVEYAKALSDHYGEAIGSLACQMYDATAAAQGVSVPDAEIAELPEYGDVAKAVYGAKKTSEKEVSKAVGRLVKQVGADTTLKNAERDGAQFAWVPSGDTCAFCITLASRGWQYMSKKALKNGHAEHIHANCDCQYAIRFDGKSEVEGYDPDKYLEMYENAEGTTSQEKINSMRREMHQSRKNAERLAKLEKVAEVSDKKLTEYALNMNHPTGKNKAKLFESELGYTQENYADLKLKILESFNEDALIYKRTSEYGTQYEQIMEIKGPNGKTANVLTAWIKENDTSKPRLVTTYVTKKKPNETI